MRLYGLPLSTCPTFPSTRHHDQAMRGTVHTQEHSSKPQLRTALLLVQLLCFLMDTQRFVPRFPLAYLQPHCAQLLQHAPHLLGLAS